MREIKFRARSITTDEWFYGTPCIHRDKLDILTIGGAPVWVTCDLKTLGQYTGLKDAKGAEIYEGDIVQDGRDGSIGMVLYAAPMFSVKEKGNLYSEEFWNLGGWKVYPDNWTLDNTEVIGNIFENPEILEANNAI